MSSFPPGIPPGRNRIRLFPPPGLVWSRQGRDFAPGSRRESSTRCPSVRARARRGGGSSRLVPTRGQRLFGPPRSIPKPPFLPPAPFSRREGASGHPAGWGAAGSASIAPRRLPCPAPDSPARRKTANPSMAHFLIRFTYCRSWGRALALQRNGARRPPGSGANQAKLNQIKPNRSKPVVPPSTP
jgi:hypothetical protein